MGWPHSHVRVQFRCLGNRWALALKPHQKQTYLFRARSFIAKHGVLLVWYHVELVGLQNCYLGFSKYWKCPQNIFLFFSKKFPLKIKIVKKRTNVRGQWLMNICTTFQVDNFKMAEIWHKTCQKQTLFSSFRDIPVIFRILFFGWFWHFKKCFKVIFCVLSEHLT